MSIDQNVLLAMLAGELDDARADLERLGTALCSNALLAAAHLEELQALDHVVQRCASVAQILRSRDMRAASQAATLESISDRFASVAEEGCDVVGDTGPTQCGDHRWYRQAGSAAR